MGFLRKSKITTRSTVNIDVYNTLLISFLKQFKKFFFHLIEHELKSLLVFKYLWLSLRKSKITAGDSLNSRLSIYAPKKVLVKKDVIYIKKIVHGQDLISRAKPGRSASYFILLIQTQNFLKMFKSFLYSRVRSKKDFSATRSDFWGKVR